MPRLSDTMDRGTVAKWNKQAGDHVKRGDVLLEIETDKANMDLESYSDGILARIIVNEGEAAAVGEPIGLVAANEEELKHIQAGAAPADGQPAAAAPVPPSPAPGAAGSVDSAPSSSLRRGPVAGEAPSDGRIKASPLAKRIAQQRGIDLARVNGTGPGGRIVREDVEGFTETSAAPSVTTEPAAKEARPPAPRPVTSRAAKQSAESEIKLSRMQIAVGRRLAESKFSAPHFYVTQDVDMTHGVRMRAQINEAEPDLKVSFNDVIVKVVGATLRSFPQINASFKGESVIRHGSINVGVAVDIPGGGLVVPVIRDADRKGLGELAAEARDLTQRAREGSLKQQDLEDGTFTVSNLGMFGVEEFTAIINPPQSAILAVGAIIEKPVVVDGEIAVRSQMKVTLSCDHRVIYGADAAAFLAELRRVLEHPVMALL